MTYAKPFFDLQLKFASRVAVLSGTSLADTLLDYTNLYARFGLGRDFDATNPRWQEYLYGLDGPTQALDWTYDFYVAQLPDRGPPDVVATFGCFSYARLNDAQIRLHFQNAESEQHSPLAAERRGHRMAELRAMFEHIRRTEHDVPPRVVGASWLYNLPAYRRLFPETYLATATTVAPRFRNLPLWGQFLGREGRVKQSMAEPFLQLLAQHQTVDGLAQCFQFQVLALEAPASHFYQFLATSPVGMRNGPS